MINTYFNLNKRVTISYFKSKVCHHDDVLSGVQEIKDVSVIFDDKLL